MSTWDTYMCNFIMDNSTWRKRPCNGIKPLCDGLMRELIGYKKNERRAKKEWQTIETKTNFTVGYMQHTINLATIKPNKYSNVFLEQNY